VSDRRWRLALAFIAVYLIWGSTYLAIRFAIETLPPFLMAGIRFVVAGGILYGWARLRGTPRPARAHWLGAAIVGTLLLVGGNGAVVWAEQYVPSGLAALIIATEPFCVVLLDWARPGGERPTLPVVAGMLAGFVGVLLLIGPADLLGGGRVHPGGALVLLLGSLLWAAGSLYAARGERLPRSPMLATGMNMLVGGAALLGLGSAVGEWGRLDLAAASLKSVLALLYLMIFGAIVGFTAYVYLLRNTTPARASTYAYVNPIIAVVLGWALAGEDISLRVGVAALAIIAAVVLITHRAAVHTGEHRSPLAPNQAESRQPRAAA
jgi:drug/metabolite transporter (DMT)-like permease